jgi:hypothetical protein
VVLTVVSWAFGLSVGQTKKDLQPQHVNQLEFANSCEHQSVVMDVCSIRRACEDWESALVFLVGVLHADNDKQH